MVGKKRKSGEMLEEGIEEMASRTAASLRHSSPSKLADAEIVDLISSSPLPEDGHDLYKKQHAAFSRDAEYNFYPSPYTSAEPSILSFDAAEAKRGLPYAPKPQPTKNPRYTSVLEHNLAIAKTKVAQANHRILQLEKQNQALRREIYGLKQVHSHPVPTARPQPNISANQWPDPHSGRNTSLPISLQRQLCLPSVQRFMNALPPSPERQTHAFPVADQRLAPMPLIPLVPKRNSSNETLHQLRTIPQNLLPSTVSYLPKAEPPHVGTFKCREHDR